MISLAKQIERKQKRLEDVKQRIEKDQARAKELEAEIAALSRSKNDSWSKNLFQALKKEGQKVDFSDLSLAEAMDALKVALTKKMETSEAEEKPEKATDSIESAEKEPGFNEKEKTQPSSETAEPAKPDEKPKKETDSAPLETNPAEKKPETENPPAASQPKQEQKKGQDDQPQEKKKDAFPDLESDEVWEIPSVY